MPTSSDRALLEERLARSEDKVSKLTEQLADEQQKHAIHVEPQVDQPQLAAGGLWPVASSIAPMSSSSGQPPSFAHLLYTVEAMQQQRQLLALQLLSQSSRRSLE
jgi:hypothetical protein